METGNWAFAETGLLSFRKPKGAIQNQNNGHEDPNDSLNNRDENHDKIEPYQGNKKVAHNDTQYQNNEHPETVL